MRNGEKKLSSLSNRIKAFIKSRKYQMLSSLIDGFISGFFLGFVVLAIVLIGTLDAPMPTNVVFVVGLAIIISLTSLVWGIYKISHQK